MLLLPATRVELEYMFDTLGFLWLYHSSPPYLLYLLEKLGNGLSDGRTKPPCSTATTTTLQEFVISMDQSFTMESAAVNKAARSSW